jgi:hypothetical protein
MEGVPCFISKKYHGGGPCFYIQKIPWRWAMLLYPKNTMEKFPIYGKAHHMKI